ncbi:MAG TPA: pyridoxal phosphate-dependent aminotransferase [Anaerolineales bacterium]|nr:pyridoxal phosphate-dependent aminotransferase [Anaerolineales bacterium]
MTHIVDQVSLGAIVQVRDRLLEQQAKGRKVLRLESGDPSFDIPPHARAAMEKALRDGLTHYTASTGIPPLREAILRKVTTENGLKVPNADHIVVTNGGMNGLYIIFRSLLDPGDEVILPDPMWTEIAENIRLGGGMPVPVRLREDEDYLYSPDDIAAAITTKTRAIFVNTPHNPTGAVVHRATLEAIAALAEKHNLLLVSDEAYEHVIFDGQKHVSLGSLPAAQNRTISVFSLSKTYAMSGLRLGYVISTDELMLGRLKKMVRCTINGVNSVAQYGAAAAINGPQDFTKSMAQEYQMRRDMLFSALEESPYVQPFKASGAFYLWARMTPDWPGYQGRRDDWSMTNYLIDQSGIGSTPGSAFGAAGDGHIRFAFSCSTAQVREAASLLPAVLKAAKK